MRVFCLIGAIYWGTWAIMDAEKHRVILSMFEGVIAGFFAWRFVHLMENTNQS